MRRILASSVALTFGLGTAVIAQDGARPAPAVTLGPPTVALGAPRAASGVRPVSFSESRIVRAKADDKSPLPPGPMLPNAGTTPLPAPTPLPGTGTPMVVAPISGGMFSPSGMPGAPCASCQNGGAMVGGPGVTEGIVADQNFAPLPGGVFAPGGPGTGCPYIFWGRAEYLYWGIREQNLPALLVAGPAGTVSVADGNLNGTSTIVGATGVGDQWRSGFRVNAGLWANECQNWGLEGSYFFLGKQTTSFGAASNGNPELGRPFFDPIGANPPTAGPGLYAEVVAMNGVAGVFQAQTSNQLWGADINVRKGLLMGCRWRLDGLSGFRYLNFEEDLQISEINRQVGVTVPLAVVLTDSFKVRNQFYGGQTGLVGEFKHGMWSVDWFAKVALGNTTQDLSIGGAQTVSLGGVPVAGAAAGLLAQGTNSGSFSRNEFSIVPEVGINLGWQATPHLRLFAGYNFLYWTNVLRAGDQIDPVLNVNSTVGPPILQRVPTVPARPAVLFRDTDLWVQGVNAGIQFTW